MRLLALLAVVLSGALCTAPLLAQAAASDPRTETEHVVRPGETLGGIAKRAAVPRLLIIAANRLTQPYLVKAGQRLIIPRRRTHLVKPGETGFSIAMDYGVPWSLIAAANAMPADQPVIAGKKLAIPTVSAAGAKAGPEPSGPDATPLADTPPPQFSWPLRGKVRRSFLTAAAKGGPHEGIDVLSPLGTPVRTSAQGKVIFAGNGPEAYGLTVILFHGGRWTTTDSFLQKVTVKEGDEVKARERIGLVGDTGLAREPQLHFEVRRNRVPIDPARYLPKGQ